MGKSSNNRRIQNILKSLPAMVESGMSPDDIRSQMSGAVTDWAKTNQRINRSNAMKGAAVVTGIGMLGGAGAGAGALKSAGASSPVSGAAPAASSGGGIMGGLKSVGSWAARNPELIIGAGQMYAGAKESARSRKLDQQALELAKQPWEETAGLRKMALEGLANRQTPNLDYIYAGSSNPFSRPLRSVR